MADHDLDLDLGRDLGSRFPALARLSRGPRTRRVPVILQHEWAECGAASLAMAMSYHGREIALDEVRRELGVGRDGLDAASIVTGAERFGMRARGIRVELEDLPCLPRGAILHWEFNHFVVFERVTRTHVEYVDPASGRQRVTLDRFSRSFTGVAVCVEPGADFEPTKLREKRYALYLQHLYGQRQLISRVVVSSVMLRLLALSLPILTALLVDHVVPRSDHHLLAVIAVGLGGAVVFHVLSNLTRAHLLLQLRTNLDVRLTLGFLEHLVDLPYAFFQRRSAGDLMMRVSSNTNIRETLTNNTLSALLDGSLVIIYLALIFWLSPTLGALTLVLGIAQVIVFMLSRRRVLDLMRENLEAQAQAQNYLVQILGGIETLKLAGAEGRAVERWSNRFVDQLNVSLDTGRLQASIDAAMAALSVTSPFLILCVGAHFVMQGELSLGQMLALNALAAGFLTPLASLVSSALQLQRLGGYIERLHDVLSTEPEQDRSTVEPAPRLSGQVSLREVSFRYDPKSPFVVREVNLDIEPGECVAIVGRSGSGKSTLAGLLLGLHTPTEGGVYYDGRKLDELELRSVRRQLGFVPQHPYVFAQSLRENIAMSHPDASIEAVTRAGKRAAIHDDIMAMTMGYDTFVSEGGGSLSGGQRQRIALARALVAEPPLLLLDEATSALDNRTEREVMRALEQMSCARVIIAHRLSTITFADRIVVMDAGRVVDVGSFEELRERCEIFRMLLAAGNEPTPELQTLGAVHE
ncbi:Lactococcin-G-processing and transport ATP-binding protein LagD [Enhygromyxa salina]|uniref:Lactococcin-G-processing and transport ATP-binding protein LagD n=1 Tax=Enhygromyxa salina TaxID=215803 RepID=A0A2S9YGJ9_9BACT|nr:peptidase domain-containing ABC transporter [Enhygromyxa salina]PRQ04234.1 Lactococcin-G-processing and transport ATP-binding protein LagD [Enhygromyxa salina]